MTEVSINGAGCPGKKKVTGKELAAWLAHASPLTRLTVAAAIAAGELDVVDPTVAQVAHMLRVKSRPVRALMALPREQRAALTTRRRVNGVARFSDEMIDDIVDKVGAVRMLAALDRCTMPPKPNGSGAHV